MQTIAQTKMLVWTAGVVVATGALALAFLLEPPTTLEKKAVVAKVETREPASAQAAFSTISLDTRNSQEAADLTLPCEGATQFDANVTQVRLSGAGCVGRTPEFESSEIKNDANGFSATVFYPNRKSFTTDYITLAPGVNSIRVMHKFKNGTREERAYVITRGAR